MDALLKENLTEVRCAWTGVAGHLGCLFHPPAGTATCKSKRPDCRVGSKTEGNHPCRTCSALLFLSPSSQSEVDARSKKLEEEGDRGTQEETRFVSYSSSLKTEQKQS